MSEPVSTNSPAPAEEALPVVEGTFTPDVPTPTTEAKPVAHVPGSEKPNTTLPTIQPPEKLPEKIGEHDLLKAFKLAAGEITENEPEPAKPAEKSAEPAKPAAVVPQQPTAKPVEDARDLTGIADEHRPLFKQMSNDAFALAKRAYVERVELSAKVKELESKTIPQSYLENPNAYILSPEHMQAKMDERQSEAIAKHWQQQLAKMRQGEKITDLIQNTDGKIVESEPFAATAETEAQLIAAISTASQRSQQARLAAENIKQTFSERVKTTVTQVKDAESRLFPGFDDEKHPSKPIMQKLSADIPSAFQGHPLTPLLLKSMAAVVMMVEKAKGLEAELTKAKTVQADAAKAQPTVRSLGSSNAAGAKSLPSYADINAYIEAP